MATIMGQTSLNELKKEVNDLKAKKALIESSKNQLQEQLNKVKVKE